MQNFGLFHSGGEYKPITSDPKPTLILRSPETLDRMFLDDVHAGRDATYVGDSSRVLPYIPRHRISETKLFHLSEDRPLALNVFYQSTYQTISDLLECFPAVWPSDVATTQIDRYMTLASLAIRHVPDGTLLFLYYFLTSDEHRAEVLSHIKDAGLKTEWQHFHDLPWRDQNNLTQSTTNRLAPILNDPLLRKIFAQTKSIDTSGVLIIDLPDGDRYKFLAALILSRTSGVAYIEKPLLHVGPTIPVFSASHLGALPKALLPDLLATATILAARLGVVDAETLDRHFNLSPGNITLTELLDGDAYLRMQKTYKIELLPHSYRARPSNERRIKANTIQRYGRPAAIIQQNIDRFLSPKPKHLDRRKTKSHPRRSGSTQRSNSDNLGEHNAAQTHPVTKDDRHDDKDGLIRDRRPGHPQC